MTSVDSRLFSISNKESHEDSEYTDNEDDEEALSTIMSTISESELRDWADDTGYDTETTDNTTPSQSLSTLNPVRPASSTARARMS